MSDLSARSGPILCVTVTTADLSTAVAVYNAGLGLVVVARGRITPALARLWDAPALDGAPWVLLAAKANGARATGGLRLVELACEPADGAPLASLGWAAAELSVIDTDARMAEACAAGFSELGAARALGSNGAIRAGQIAGPSGEALYLTDVRAYAGGLELCRARLPVERCFIAVLASGDLEADRAWLEDHAIGRRISDRPVDVPVLKRTMNLPDDHRIRISSLQLAGESLIEIDAYPSGVAERAGRQGWPLGVAMVTLVAAIDGGEAIAMPPYEGRRVRMDRLPGGARLERVAA
ncbi:MULTISPECIES: hypothetical protein [unclassified Roseitalea]|uniref:hypothetical protein n=1 Tax=unclassified Roseitalea TaxID=2639107 RepID=UPI00273D64EF|nr:MULTISPECIES: hypothetical protein [unclassified Roseitalea]